MNRLLSPIRRDPELQVAVATALYGGRGTLNCSIVPE